MKKKILMISGSPRKNGDGAKIFHVLESKFGVDSEIEYETLFIKDFNIEMCRGCLACQKKAGDKCPIKDDITLIKEKFNEADGFVFISPVHIRMISAHMKLLFDRLVFLLHRPVHAGKPAILLCTSSYVGIKESLTYLKIPVSNMGMHIVGSLGILSTAFKHNTDYRKDVLKDLDQITKSFIEKVMSQKMPVPNAKELIIFNKWRYKAIFHQKQYPGDFQFWNDQNLLDKDYYYQVRINPLLKLLIPFIVKRVLTKLSRKIGYLPG